MNAAQISVCRYVSQFIRFSLLFDLIFFHDDSSVIYHSSRVPTRIVHSLLSQAARKQFWPRKISVDPFISIYLYAVHTRAPDTNTQYLKVKRDTNT